MKYKAVEDLTVYTATEKIPLKSASQKQLERLFKSGHRGIEEVEEKAVKTDK